MARKGTLPLVAALVLIAAVAGLWWLNAARSYDELELGSSTSAGPDGRFIDAGSVELVRKTLREGAVTTFGVSVDNRGRRDVEITGVGPQRAPDDAEVQDIRLTPASVRMNPADGPGTAERTVPFRPFVLRAGRERYFVIALLMPACSNYAPGSILTIGTFGVRFRSLIFDRDQAIELREPIDIVRTKNCA